MSFLLQQRASGIQSGRGHTGPRQPGAAGWGLLEQTTLLSPKPRPLAPRVRAGSGTSHLSPRQGIAAPRAEAASQADVVAL